VTGTIHLIVEDRKDANVIETILRAKKINVGVRPLPPKHGGIARLASELDRLIQLALRDRKPGDCVAVMHDTDTQTVTDPDKRKVYEEIKRICRNYRKEIKHIEVKDELEAWLLADGGLCTWLDIKPQNCDSLRKPSEKLISLAQSKYRLKYQGVDRAKILAQIDGTGEQYSPSMRAALKHLENAPCIQESQ
jgi:hypothetical protein